MGGYIKIKFQIKNQYDKYLDKLFKNITSNSYIWRVDYDEVFRGDYSFLFNKSEYNDIEFHKIIEHEDYYIVQLQLQLFDDNKLLLEMKVVDNIFVEINVYDKSLLTYIRASVNNVKGCSKNSNEYERYFENK